MTIAVTGATGQLGRIVVDELIAREPDAEPIAIARDAAKAERVLPARAEVWVADYTDPATLREALAGVETLLLISSNEVGQRFDQHKNVIDAAGDAGVGRLVYTSIAHADTSRLPLAPEHLQTEEYLAESGLAHTILRNNWYHENYLQQIDAARATGALVAAVGDGRVASASRADYAAGAAAVLVEDGHEGRVYEFSGDTAWTYDDLATALSEVAGREVVYQPVDSEDLVAHLSSVGLDEGTARFVAALDTGIAAGDLAGTDGTLARLIGRPTTPLIETLRAET